MSGICGFFNLDGSAAESRILEAMQSGLSVQRPALPGSSSQRFASSESDDVGRWCAGPVALAEASFANPACSVLALQHHESSGIALVFDGRLDNRAELYAACGPALIPVREASDGDYLIAAYRRWGSDLCEHLIGDFAFALWDVAAGQLLAARDPMGVRAFFYSLREGVFVFASRERVLLAHPSVSVSVNEGAVAELLAMRFSGNAETAFTDVQRLEPGKQVLIDASGMQEQDFWQQPAYERLRYRRPEEYVEHFLDLFRRAVGDRLGGVGDTAVMLSGGMDSAAVAGMTHTLVGAAGDNSSVKAYSLLVPSTYGIDERPCMEATAERCGIPVAYLTTGRLPFPDWESEVRESRELPLFPLAAMHAAVYRIAADAGVGAVLTGGGSDSWFGAGLYPYADLLLRAEVGPLLSELCIHAASRGWRDTLRRLTGSLGWPLLPAAARSALEQSRRRVPSNTLLRGEFARRTCLEGRLHQGDTAADFVSLDRWERWRRGKDPRSVFALEQTQYAAEQAGVEERHPFLDRRLIEFALQLPPEYRRREGQNKYLIARSGLVSETVLRANVSAEFDSVVHRAITTAPVRERLTSLASTTREWVKADAVELLLARMQAPYESLSVSDIVRARELWNVYAIDLWLSSLRG